MGLYRNHRHQAKELREYVMTVGKEDETYPIKEIATTGRSKCFNGKYLSRFHLSVVVVLDKWYRFPGVNAILFDIVPRDVAHRLDREGPTIDVNLVAFHSLLYGSANIADADIDSRSLEVVSIRSSLTPNDCLPLCQYLSRP